MEIKLQEKIDLINGMCMGPNTRHITIITGHFYQLSSDISITFDTENIDC